MLITSQELGLKPLHTHCYIWSFKNKMAILRDMLTFPNIDSIAIEFGFVAIRWYSLAYMAGIVGGWYIIKRLAVRHPIENLNQSAIDDLIMWAVIGIVAGGRLGYVLFYKPEFYGQNPAMILQLWQGGMAYHGGLLGVIATFFIFCRRRKIGFLSLMDRVAPAATLGLFFGRIANFINGELYGRITDSPLGMVFPTGGPMPRHPSQLYQAGMEGLLLGLLLFCVLRYSRALTKPGTLSGLFLIGYASARIIGEQFRQPDAHLGFVMGEMTMGQLLSVPMILVGLLLILKSNNYDSDHPDTGRP